MELEEEVDTTLPVKSKKRNFEMNIPFDMAESEDPVAIATLTQFIWDGINDGYEVFVVTHTIAHEITNKDEWKFDPKKLKIEEKFDSYAPSSLPVHKEFVKIPSLSNVVILTRLDVIVETPQIAQQLMNTNGGNNNTKMSKILHTYDLLSASVTTDKLFELLIHKSDIDILSLDFCEPIRFFFNKKLIRQAIDKHIMFEISYSKALSDSKAYRKQFLGKTRELVEVTKGKNVILSWGSLMQILQRNPHDVVSLGELMGLNRQQAMNALQSNWEDLVKRCRLRKSFKGAAEIVDQLEIEKNKDYTERVRESLLDKDLGQNEADMEQ
jgi:ribonuclease P/MRP protein subunit RPP1